MAKLSVVEAATLSGRTPAEIRRLIREGRLAAELLALPTGTGYLIEADGLTALGVNPTAVLATVGSGRLRAALANLKAALARRQGHQAPAADEDREPVVPPGPSPRAVGGLRSAELEALSGQIERLLAP